MNKLFLVTIIAFSTSVSASTNDCTTDEVVSYIDTLKKPLMASVPIQNSNNFIESRTQSKIESGEIDPCDDLFNFNQLKIFEYTQKAMKEIERVYDQAIALYDSAAGLDVALIQASMREALNTYIEEALKKWGKEAICKRLLHERDKIEDKALGFIKGSSAYIAKSAELDAILNDHGFTINFETLVSGNFDTKVVAEEMFRNRINQQGGWWRDSLLIRDAIASKDRKSSESKRVLDEIIDPQIKALKDKYY
ncbi:hypothetical protein [Photobacterium leiognathi]|uniref:hypothetical protein n=1 Tax=Photobacterium leiognathi TaxID=553611 RepID=UPI0029827F21|nr:hypothetical protein [Photobacterium leiognathi]